MAAGCNRDFRNSVRGLPVGLKRSGGVDGDEGAKGEKGSSEIRCRPIQNGGSATMPATEGFSLLLAAACDDDVQMLVSQQRLGQLSAKNAIAAENDDPFPSGTFSLGAVPSAQPTAGDRFVCRADSGFGQSCHKSSPRACAAEDPAP